VLGLGFSFRVYELFSLHLETALGSKLFFQGLGFRVQDFGSRV
jgi:hypothetical protein